MRPQQLFKDLKTNFSDILYSGLLVDDELKYDEIESGLDPDEYEAIVTRLYFLAVDPSKTIKFFITQYREGKYLYFLKITEGLWIFILCENDSFAKLHFYIQFLLSDSELETSEEEILEESDKDAKQLDSAKRIQELMFPNMKTALEKFADHLFWYQPKEEVGGDFYWVNKQKERTWVVLGDCTGHGMEGALASVSIMSILNQVFERGISPHMLIKETHRSLSDMQNQNLTDGYGIGCEMIALCFDHKTKTLKYSGTGFPLYHFSEGKVTMHRTKNAGFMPELVVKYLRSRTIRLKDGDGLFSHSDGLVDQMDSRGKKLRKRRLLKRFEEEGTVTDHNSRLYVEEHRSGEPQTDDIVSLFLKI